MSAFKRAFTTVASYPAYDVRKQINSSEYGCIELSAGDHLGLDSGKDFYYEYTIDSAVSYALESGRCPIEMYNNAIARGHSVYWINACGAMLTSTPQKKRYLIEVTYGMKVKFEGKFFTIEKDHNNNLKLVQIV